MLIITETALNPMEFLDRNCHLKFYIILSIGVFLGTDAIALGYGIGALRYSSKLREIFSILLGTWLNTY